MGLDLAPARLDHLKEGVAVGRLALDLDREDTEEKHLEKGGDGREMEGRSEGDGREIVEGSKAKGWVAGGRQVQMGWRWARRWTLKI